MQKVDLKQVFWLVINQMKIKKIAKLRTHVSLVLEVVISNQTPIDNSTTSVGYYNTANAAS